MCLKVLFLVLLKLDSIAAELAVSLLYPNIGIIISDQSGKSLTHLIIIGTSVGRYIGLIPVPSFNDRLLLSYISCAHD